MTLTDHYWTTIEHPSREAPDRHPNIFGAVLILLYLKRQGMETGVDAPNLDTVYGLLSESRRRYALYYLLNAEQTTVEDLALGIVAWEQDSDIESVSEAETEPVVVSLHHTHLPRLEDHGIITYDEQGGDIGIGSNFDTVRSTVERARDIEGTESAVGTVGKSFSYREPVAEYSNTE